MAKETTETKFASKEKLFRVGLSQRFKRPEYKGKPKEGVIYIRGGYQFHAEDGEGLSYHIVPERELEKFLIAKNQQFVNSPLVKEIDHNLFVEEVK